MDIVYKQRNSEEYRSLELDLQRNRDRFNKKVKCYAISRPEKLKMLQ